MPTSTVSTAPLPNEISPHALRAAVGHFPTGVAIVTTTDHDMSPVGCTVSSFLSVSLNPPIVAVSLAGCAATLTHITNRGKFAISVLAGSQHGIAHQFASRDVSHEQRFRAVRWRPGSLGMPLLENGLSTIECEVHEIVPAGDHHLVLGAVSSLYASGWGSPLVHHQGRLGALSAVS
jgi:3-hydroxy-9,10-secoandrosta-1,3,5(10)-triene-9,17-dione monooxygenase reductase component